MIDWFLDKILLSFPFPFLLYILSLSTTVLRLYHELCLCLECATMKLSEYLVRANTLVLLFPALADGAAISRAVAGDQA